MDAKRRTCLGSKPCKFIFVKAFDTGEFLSNPKFFKKNGFLSTPEREKLFFLPIEGCYEPASALKEYEPLPEDRNRAVILCGPICQFSYQFAKKMEEQIREVAPNVPIELINEWEKPEESIKRRNNVLTVNAKPIRTFFMDTLRFKGGEACVGRKAPKKLVFKRILKGLIRNGKKSLKATYVEVMESV